MASADGRELPGERRGLAYSGLTRKQVRLHEYLSRSECGRHAEENERVRGLIPHWFDASQARLLSVLVMEERHADIESLVVAFEGLLLDGEESF